MKKDQFLYYLLLFISIICFSPISYAEGEPDLNDVNTFYVSTEAELERVLNSVELKSNDVISINNSIEISQPIKITKRIKIEGNGNCIKLKDTVKAGFVFEIEDTTSLKDWIVIENISLKGQLDVNAPQVDLKEGGILIKNSSLIVLNDVKMSNFKGYGIYTENTKKLKINDCKIINFGFAGFMGYSVEDVNILDGTVKGAYKGLSSTTSKKTIAYNIAFSRKSYSSLQDFPVSKNSSVENVEIGSNPIWEGLDTHGGQNIKFINNIIKDVKVPVAAVPSEVNGEDVYAPHNILIQGNVIENTGHLNRIEVNKGIVLSGAKYSFINPTGEPIEYATGEIKDNQIKGYGESASSLNTGAIFIQATKGAVISGNVISRSYISGITAYMQNVGFTIEKNYIDGFLENEFKFPACITVKDKWNEGRINYNECFTIAFPKYSPLEIEELQRINTNPIFSSIRGIYVGTLDNVEVKAIGNKFGKGINQAYRYMYLESGKGDSAIYSTKK